MDFSGVDGFDLSYLEIGMIAKKSEAVIATKGLKHVYLFAKNDVVYGIARTYQALADYHDLVVDIFRDWEEMVRVISERMKE